MNLDKTIAEKIFLKTKKSTLFSRLAIFGARRLVWILAGLVLLWLVLDSSPLTPPLVKALFKNWFRGEGEGFDGWERQLVVIFGILLAWVTQLIIAYTVNRRRPFQQNHKKPLMKPLWQTPSFPSGHTTIACALAAGVFVFDPLLGSALFIVAALVALSRIAIGVHYFSDVIGGAVLGIGAVIVITRLIV